MTIKFKDKEKALPAKEEPKPVEEKREFRTRAPNNTFDRKTYMREYMKARRKKT
jgi:hypothetical protein